MQEDSEKTGKVTSAGMYFLHFQVYRMDSTVNAVCELSFLTLSSLSLLDVCLVVVRSDGLFMCYAVSNS